MIEVAKRLGGTYEYPGYIRVERNGTIWHMGNDEEDTLHLDRVDEDGEVLEVVDTGFPKNIDSPELLAAVYRCAMLGYTV